ncbi:hypothetical protein BW687_018260 [Pseudomonas graminis]|uniref:hypothetical protein n=1 Tax=Pseudomonas graminis TaxID=158627 RepID=UPI00234BAC73|nr:hypothetical protein [Pseudomonas graminis]MDC6382112.1 hypothetical protein [Pseudomonas graminis]
MLTRHQAFFTNSTSVGKLLATGIADAGVAWPLSTETGIALFLHEPASEHR